LGAECENNPAQFQGGLKVNKNSAEGEVFFVDFPSYRTFQVIRRTIATLAQKKGTVKDVQGVLRHSRTATTTDVYMQEIPESVQATVNSINRELRKSGSEKTSRTTPKRKSATAVFPGKRSSKRAVPEGVFESLTPNDTKRSEKEVACFR
jgi:hypothetical protein